MTLDFGVAGVNVQSAIFRVATCKPTTCWVSVGNDASPFNNPRCGSMVADAYYWSMQSCNLAGRYVSLIQNSDPS